MSPAPVLVLLGPTCSGKSALAMELAGRLSREQQTLSRKTDGGAEWVLVEGGTIGKSNGSEPVVEIKLFVNEVSCGLKQFEIYNASSKDVDIAGYSFTKDDGDPWVVPAGKGNIPAKGFIVYTAKNPDLNEGPSFGLSGTKGFKLCMYSSETPSAETLVDMIDNSKDLDTFKTVEDSETIGRKTDGAAEIVEVPITTEPLNK